MAESEFQNRLYLPSPMLSRSDINIWAKLKNCLGKDLSKITMPVVLNEPLSFLQRICEYMEYAYLLKEAAGQENAADRMKYVASFAVSALASNWERIGKPFNPLLGETYELQRNGYKIICEQVSHHPPVSAFHAESPDFKFYGSINPKIKFLGKSIEIQPKGIVTVELLKWNEAYTWTNVNCCVHNIVVGKLWIEQYGTMEIVNHKTHNKAVLNFKSGGCSVKNLHKVDGYVQDARNHNIYFLYGKWNEFLKCSAYDCYQEYLKEMKKNTNEPSENTQRNVFSKLHSFKMDSFRSLSINENESDVAVETKSAHNDSTHKFDIPGSELLWKANERPEYSSQYFHFTTFAMQLNERVPAISSPNTICPTDSRLRPDIACLESGDMDEASNQKTRLEEKQRDTKRIRKGQSAETYKPRWFTYDKNTFTGLEDWMYTGDYWKRDYSHISGIF